MDEARKPVITLVQPEPNYRPSNSDADVKSLVRRLLDIEDQIDAQQKLKSFVIAEARCSGIDIAALKAVVRTHRYLPESRESGMSGLSETVKRYLDSVNNVSTDHKKSEG